MNVVISGPTGVIGMALLDLLERGGYSILLLMNPSSSRLHQIKARERIRIVFCDMSDYDKIIINEQYDIFYHFAWEGGGYRDDVNTNIKSALAAENAVKLASRIGCKMFVGAGSQAECGRHSQPISDQTFCSPENVFGAAKLLALNLCKIKSQHFGIRFCWARILSVYGPYDGNQTLVMSTINKLINGEKLFLTEGVQVWDYLYSSDAAEAMLAIGNSNDSSGVYTIASGNGVSLRHYLCIIAKQFGRIVEDEFGLIKYKDTDVMYLVGDVIRLKRELFWEPKINFQTGIEKTVNYCLQKI